MPLAPGVRLGPYEVTAKLGEGGMGEVFRVRDTRLARDVALKVLPEAVSADADRRARFAREARALASLNPRSDIFSLGIVLYEMITGERPFKGDTSLSVLSAILRDTPTPVTDLAPSTPDALARLVRRCLAKDPHDRVQ